MFALSTFFLFRVWPSCASPWKSAGTMMLRLASQLAVWRNVPHSYTDLLHLTHQSSPYLTHGSLCSLPLPTYSYQRKSQASDKWMSCSSCGVITADLQDRRRLSWGRDVSRVRAWLSLGWGHVVEEMRLPRKDPWLSSWCYNMYIAMPSSMPQNLCEIARILPLFPFDLQPQSHVYTAKKENVFFLYNGTWMLNAWRDSSLEYDIITAAKRSTLLTSSSGQGGKWGWEGIQLRYDIFTVMVSVWLLLQIVALLLFGFTLIRKEKACITHLGVQVKEEYSRIGVRVRVGIQLAKDAI